MPRKIQLLSQVCAFAAGSLAVLSLLGWQLDMRFLAGQWGDYVPMAPSTAIAFLLLSSMLFTHTRWPAQGWNWNLSLAALTLILFVAALVLLQFFLGFDVGLEQKLSRTNELLGGIPVGRMSFLTAILFILESSAFVLFLVFGQWRHTIAASVVLAVGATTMSTVVLAGYLYNAPLLYGGIAVPVALPTAMAFVAIGIGQINLSVNTVHLFYEWRSTSIQGHLLRAFLPWISIGVLLITWLAYLATNYELYNPAVVSSLEAIIILVIIMGITGWIARKTGTEIEHTQSLLKESQERLQSIFDGAHDGIVLSDGDGGYILDCNKEFEKQTGWKLKQLQTMRISDIRPKEEQEVARKRFLELLEKSEVESTDLGFQRPDGSRVPVDIRSRLVKIRGKTYALSVSRDITGRKKAAKALQESEEKYRNLVETADDVILLTDLNGRHIFRNSAYYTSLGFMVGDDVDLDGFARVHPDDLPLLKGYADDLLKTGQLLSEYRVRHKDGHWVHRLARTKVIYDQNHSPTAFLAIIRDITEQKLSAELVQSLQRDLLERNMQLQIETLKKEKAQSEKMAIIGQMASIVAHEMRNPLGIITNSLYLVKRLSGTDAAKTYQHLETASKATSSASRIVEDLLDYARPKKPVMEPVKLNAILEEALSRLVPDGNIEVIKEFSPGMSPVQGDAEMLQRVLINLIQNALQSMPRGGTLKLKTSTPGEWQEVSIIDTGEGMSEETKKNLFQPLFSTRTKGVGLGLFISQQIVTQHGGSIEVSSELGKGTSITVRLPSGDRNKSDGNA